MFYPFRIGIPNKFLRYFRKALQEQSIYYSEKYFYNWKRIPFRELEVV